MKRQMISRRVGSSVTRGTGKGIILNPGLLRAGSASLSSALDHLGFGPTFHAATNSPALNAKFHWFTDEDRILRMMDGDTSLDFADFATYTGVRTFMDFSVIPIWKTVFNRYPESRVIVCHRDFDSWYESVRVTLETILFNDDFNRMMLDSPLAGLPRSGARFFNDQSIWMDRDRKMEAKRIYYDEYLSEIESTVPSDQLLIMDVRQGWKPLCHFLDVPIPESNVPFPRKNSRQELIAAVESQKRMLPILKVFLHFQRAIGRIQTSDLARRMLEK